MANIPQTLALVTLAQHYRNEIVAQINRRSPLLRLLRIEEGEGKNYAFVAEGSGAVAEGYTEGADQSNFGSDLQKGAILEWGNARAAFTITGKAMSAAASSQSPAGNVQLYLRNMRTASSALASLINVKLYAGTTNDPTGIVGLCDAIGDTTNTYATVDRTNSANAFFRPTVIDPGTPTAITLTDIRDDLRKIYELGGENPDIALCSPTVFNKIGALFDNVRRETRVVTARGEVNLEGGFAGIEFDGVVFVRDKDCTAATIYYVNTNHTFIPYLPPKLPPGVQKVDIRANDGYGDLPLGFTFETLAQTGDAYKAFAKSYAQLVCTRPNTCGTRYNVKVV